MSNFLKSLAVLESLVSKEIIEKISFQDALEQESSTQDPDKYSPSFLDVKSYLVLSDSIPRKEKTVSDWKTSILDFDTNDIKSFLNDIEDDPHLKADLISIYEVLENLGLNPSYNTTTQDFEVEHLILCGTGDGKEVLDLVNQLKPKIITILVGQWEDWVSSFNHIDWLEIWNSYCLQEGFQISASQSDHTDSIINDLVFKHILSLDHAYVYKASTASRKTQQIYDKLMSGIVDRVIAYTGFTMDEYNMFWNSSVSLMKEPRVFNHPYPLMPKGDYLVVGSGPSLEKHLDFIYENNQNFIIVACASNYGTLRRRGIRVDVLCLLERGEFMFEQYSETVAKYGADNTLLFASVTSPARIHNLFIDTMIYFRPSLTPFSIYGDSPRQLLLNEGPQSVNTGVAFALSQSPSSIILCGADFGTVSLETPRAPDAIGVSPRTFNRQEKGNLRQTVFTNDLLMDGVRVLAGIGYSFKNTDTLKLLNMSDGVEISGWKPVTQSDLSIQNQNESKKRLRTWWQRQKRYSYQSFSSNFQAAKPRQHVYNTLSLIRQSLSNLTVESWLQVRYEIIQILTLRDNQNRYEQICSRMIRGNLYRYLIAINRQLIILSQKGTSSQQAFLSAIKVALSKRIDSFQREIFQLIDFIESRNH